MGRVVLEEVLGISSGSKYIILIRGCTVVAGITFEVACEEVS